MIVHTFKETVIGKLVLSPLLVLAHNAPPAGIGMKDPAAGIVAHFEKPSASSMVTSTTSP